MTQSWGTRLWAMFTGIPATTETKPKATAAVPSKQVITHLSPEHWTWANRMLVRKAISEFAHELLLTPVADGGNGQYKLDAPKAAGTVYKFRATKMRLDHWHIDPASLGKWVNGVAAPLDAVKFIIEFKDLLGIREAMIPSYIDEISSILYSSAYKRAVKPHTAAELALADFQTIETGMTEGHPVFVANSGRTGFTTTDFPSYAPEAAKPLPIIWLAVLRENTLFTSLSTLDYDRLIQEELGAETVQSFEANLKDQGLDPALYYFMPVHPWQWYNRISMAFAPELARCNIVYLGESPDLYQPQQSIRTFYNTTNPQKRYVKMALSILNMGFMLVRGLSPEDMCVTPPINEWLKNLIKQDSYLQENGFRIICEVATISFQNQYYEQGVKDDIPQKHMLSALWRDSPTAHLIPGERIMTMAALLHLDPDGNALIAALIENSDLRAREWLDRYLRAYLHPILHCYYTYDIIFMPHGENVILALKDNIPIHMVMKDLAEEMRILNDGSELPRAVRHNCDILDDDVRLDGIFTDVFDCYFRYLAAILDEQQLLSEDQFWAAVAETIREYQQSQPHLSDKFARYDLFAAEFPRNCINRLQLRDNYELLNPDDPDKGFQYVGTLPNPLAEFANKR